MTIPPSLPLELALSIYLSINRTLPLSSLCIQSTPLIPKASLKLLPLFASPKMHSLMIPCSFALLLPLLLLFADARSENLNEQVIFPVDQLPFDNNNTLTTSVEKTFETEITAAKYAYLMKLKVKTSDAVGDDDYIDTYATLDTGSDLIWLNAIDCVGEGCHCRTKTTNHQHCIKKPQQPIPCEDRKYCKALMESLKIKTCSPSRQCEYDITYPDGLTTHGMLGTGTFSFPSFEDKITFGVSKETKTKGHLDRKSVGVVGLGRGELSLLKQLSIRERKFSYCLPIPNPESSPNAKSKIKFGGKVATSDNFSTQLLTKQGGPVCEHRYCVHLATISLNDRDEGKITVSEVMVIDSGSTFTYLANGLFNKFFEKVTNVIGHKPKPVEPYDNCFEESESAKKLKVSFEFGGVGGGGTKKIELKQENFLDRHASNEGKTYLCLTVVDGGKKKNNHGRLLHEEDFGRENENSNRPHILGNRAQMDFLVAFDLKDKKVSFDKKKCSD